MNPYSKIKHKTVYEWHLYWLHEDMGFISDIATLHIMWEMASDYEYSHDIPQVYDDETYIKMIDKYSKYWKFISNKYRIADDYLSDIYVSFKKPRINSMLDSNGFIDSKIELVGKQKNHAVLAVYFSPEITHKEYLESWLLITNILKKKDMELPTRNTRRRAPDDTRLIYAIFKSRCNGLTFKRIFTLYQQGRLPLYLNSPTNQFSSEDSLESYYQKYKPRINTIT